jgi:hypothetical protein
LACVMVLVCSHMPVRQHIYSSIMMYMSDMDVGCTKPWTTQ